MLRKPIRQSNKKKYNDSLKGQTSNRRLALRRKYGITLEQFDEMVKSQNGVCLICQKVNVAGRVLVVDHDHHSGVVRGLLCTPCNTLIGRWRDSPESADRARAYLRRHAQLRLVV